MPVTIRRCERLPWLVLRVAGELDVVGAPELRQAVVSATAEGSRLVALDLSELDFLDSFGIGVIVGALKRLRQRGGDLAVVCPIPRIRRVFEICDLDKIIALHDSVESLEAVPDEPQKKPSLKALRPRNKTDELLH